MTAEERAKKWRSLIAATRRKVNFGWWLEMLGPLSIGYGVLAASGLLYLRSQPWFAEKFNLAAMIAGGVLLLLPIVAWLLARLRFISAKEAAVRLESEMGLHNALTAAKSGVSEWPEPPANPQIRDGFAWNWGRLAIPPLLAVALVAAAFLIPVQPIQAKAEARNEPIAWEEMEEWLEELQEEKVAEEEKVEEVMKQIGALRDQPEEEWFSHSSLEATDTLRENLQRSINDMEKNLSTADRSLGALEKYSEMMSEGARDQLLQEFNDALKGLEFGNLPADQKMMEALKGIDPAQLQQMNAQQMEQLRQAMQQNAQRLREMMAQGEGQGEGEGKGQGGGWGNNFEDEEELMKLLFGEGWREGMKPGQGGINRGRGDAPMFHNDNESNLNTNNPEGVQNLDVSRAAPGEVIAEGTAEHDIDKTPTGPSAAGAVNSAGKGGESVWESNLLPSERAVLERYFK